jgi:AraC-like DNA-binding protein
MPLTWNSPAIPDMKPQFESVNIAENASISTLHTLSKSFEHPFHYHPELELTLIKRGSGTRIIADQVTPFYSGDLCLIGANLPHIYRRESLPQMKHQEPYAEFIVIKFRASAIQAIAGLPEFSEIARMLQRAKRGLHFQTQLNGDIATAMERCAAMEGAEQWLAWIQIMHQLARIESAEIASPGLQFQPAAKAQASVDKVCQYIFENLEEPLKLETVAAQVHMSESAFSRFFQRHMQLSFSQFLIQVRLGRACQLLIETDVGIAEACYHSGFGNLSNFNRRFKEHFKMSPREWRHQHQ